MRRVRTPKFVTKNILKDDLSNWYERHVTNVVRRHRVDSVNIDEEDARWIMSWVNFQTNRAVDPGDQQDAADSDAEDSDGSQIEEVTGLERIGRFVPALYQYVLWFTVFLCAQMLLQGTVEEKSSKLVEVLLSNTDADHLLEVKIVGILATVLTVVGVWVGFAAIPIFLSPMLSIIDPQIIGSVFNPVYVSNFVLYFVLGFLFYGYLFSAIGSCCSTIRRRSSACHTRECVVNHSNFVDRTLSDGSDWNVGKHLKTHSAVYSVCHDEHRSGNTALVYVCRNFAVDDGLYCRHSVACF